jgi:hypothetical protein
VHSDGRAAAFSFKKIDAAAFSIELFSHGSIDSLSHLEPTHL